MPPDDGIIQLTHSKFKRGIKEEAETAEAVLDALLSGFLSGFQIVVIQLDGNDDAQEIFASTKRPGEASVSV